MTQAASDTSLAPNNTALPLSPLIEACQQGNANTVKQLLTDDPTAINAIDQYGNNALWAACFAQSQACIEVLLAHNVDMNYQSPTGNTALMFAASSGRDEIVKLLLDKGADAGIENQDGMTALDLVSSLTSLKLLRAHRG